MRVLAVIPARYAATRLPGKPLSLICGKPMIQWVWENVSRAKSVHEVVVATDDERILKCVQGFGGTAIMTDAKLPSGTDRVAAIAQDRPCDFIVNVQGDEPLLDPAAIDAAVQLIQMGQFPLTTVMTPFASSEELDAPSVVKVLVDCMHRAIYFSRYPIPYSRGPRPDSAAQYACRKHVGLYVYSRSALSLLTSLPPSAIEKGESLEQLRAMEAGLAIGVALVEGNFLAVDTPEDLERVSRVMSDKLKRLQN